MADFKDGVVTEVIDLGILALSDEKQWGFNLITKPSWSKFPVKMMIRKDSIKDGFIEQIRATCKIAHEVQNAFDNGTESSLPVIQTRARVIRGNPKNTATETVTDDQGNKYDRVMADKKDLAWSYFWDIDEILDETSNKPAPTASAPTPSAPATTLGNVTKTQTESREYGMNRRTALMQAVATATSLNVGREIELQIDFADVIAISDHYLKWLDQPQAPQPVEESQAITQESPNSLVEHAKAQGAEVIAEVPKLETMGALNTYLTEDKGFKVEDIKAMISQLGYKSSEEYFSAKGGSSPDTITALAVALIRQYADISGDLPW